jgi:NAD(P)H-flavin reductase
VYGLACLYSIIDAAKQNRSIVRDVHFVWMIRSRGELPPATGLAGSSPHG